MSRVLRGQRPQAKRVLSIVDWSGSQHSVHMCKSVGSFFDSQSIPWIANMQSVFHPKYEYVLVFLPNVYIWKKFAHRSIINCSYCLFVTFVQLKLVFQPMFNINFFVYNMIKLNDSIDFMYHQPVWRHTSKDCFCDKNTCRLALAGPTKSRTTLCLSWQYCWRRSQFYCFVCSFQQLTLSMISSVQSQVVHQHYSFLLYYIIVQSLTKRKKLLLQQLEF